MFPVVSCAEGWSVRSGILCTLLLRGAEGSCCFCLIGLALFHFVKALAGFLVPVPGSCFLSSPTPNAGESVTSVTGNPLPVAALRCPRRVLVVVVLKVSLLHDLHCILRFF